MFFLTSCSSAISTAVGLLFPAVVALSYQLQFRSFPLRLLFLTSCRFALSLPVGPLVHACCWLRSLFLFHWSQSSFPLHVLRVDQMLFFGLHACAVLRGALVPPETFFLWFPGRRLARRRCGRAPWPCKPIPPPQAATYRTSATVLTPGTSRPVPPEPVGPSLPVHGRSWRRSRGHQTHNALVLPPASTVVERLPREGSCCHPRRLEIFIEVHLRLAVGFVLHAESECRTTKSETFPNVLGRLSLCVAKKNWYRNSNLLHTLVCLGSFLHVSEDECVDLARRVLSQSSSQTRRAPGIELQMSSAQMFNVHIIHTK